MIQRLLLFTDKLFLFRPDSEVIILFIIFTSEFFSALTHVPITLAFLISFTLSNFNLLFFAWIIEGET